jgi:hypothetical protein
MKGNRRTATQQRGFTITQMVITLAIISIISTFGVLGIRNARAEFRLHSSARLFASYVEKARADSIRRHAPAGTESSIQTFGAGTTRYAVTMDWGGGIETRNFELESGLEFSTDAQRVIFDWRGRNTVPCDVTKACVFQIYSQYLKYAVPVDVSTSGDITVGAQHFPDGLIPEVALGPTNDGLEPTPHPSDNPSPSPSPNETASPTPSPTETASPTPSPTASPTATPHGNGNGNGNDGNNGNGNGNGNASPTPTPAASPTPTPAQPCVSTISPSSLSLSQSDSTRQTGTAIFTMTNATGVRIISASQVGNGNSFVIGVSLQRIDGSGSSVISVTAKQGGGNRGTFTIQVSADPACGSAQTLSVSVSN